MDAHLAKPISNGGSAEASAMERCNRSTTAGGVPAGRRARQTRNRLAQTTERPRPTAAGSAAAAAVAVELSERTHLSALDQGQIGHNSVEGIFDAACQ
jgi:hypothetical protein